MKKIQEFILREVADEYILIPTGKTTETFNGIISLSETGAFIYEHLEEAPSFDALVDMITKEYDVDRNGISGCIPVHQQYDCQRYGRSE